MVERIPEPDESLYINPFDVTDLSFAYNLPLRSALTELRVYWENETEKADQTENRVLQAISGNLQTQMQNAADCAAAIQYILIRGALHRDFLEKWQRSIVASTAMSSLTHFICSGSRDTGMHFDNKDFDFIWYMPDQDPPVHRVLCHNDKLQADLLPAPNQAHWIDTGNAYAKISRQDVLPAGFTETMAGRFGSVELSPNDYTSFIPYLKRSVWLQDFTS